MDLINSEKHIPWIVYEAKKWLDSYLGKDMTVFEWGSGGSTIYFSKKSKKIISIEHNKEWHAKVSAAIRHEKIKNCSYFLIVPQKSIFARFLPYGSYTYVSKTFKEHANLSFSDYAKKIDEYSNEAFDLVVVDGRSRVACMSHAIKKIKKGGFLLLDNSERNLYLPAMNKLNKFYRQDFLATVRIMKKNGRQQSGRSNNEKDIYKVI